MNIVTVLAQEGGGGLHFPPMSELVEWRGILFKDT